MSLTKKEWEDLVNDYSDIKADIKVLEKKEERLKNAILNALKDADANTVFTDYYKLTKSLRTRKTISKKDLPSDIWDKYAKESEFYVLTLKKR